jgi:hypothetical protein
MLYREQDSEIAEAIDASEFVARVLTHVPDPRRHIVHHYGAYSNVSRGKRKKGATGLQPATDEPEEPDFLSTPWPRERVHFTAVLVHRSRTRARDSRDTRPLAPAASTRTRAAAQPGSRPPDRAA